MNRRTSIDDYDKEGEEDGSTDSNRMMVTTTTATMTIMMMLTTLQTFHLSTKLVMVLKETTGWSRIDVKIIFSNHGSDGILTFGSGVSDLLSYCWLLGFFQ